MIQTLTIQDVLAGASRARIVRISLDGRALPFRPGEALAVATAGYERRRAYSIASAPADVERTGVVELLVGVDEHGSAGPHLRLEPGAHVDVEGPIGGFMFPDGHHERQFVFVAGGTGIAPIRGMLREVLSTRAVAPTVLYSARTRHDFAYLDELRALAAAGRIELRLTITRGLMDDEWCGGRGRIDHQLIAALVRDPAPLWFVCGPASLVMAVQNVLKSLGVTAEEIRIEEWVRAHLARTTAASPVEMQG